MKKIYSLLTVVLVFVPFAVQAAFGDTTTYLSKPFEVHKARLAKDALFDFPTDIDVTDDGIFVIADTYNHAIRKITKKGKILHRSQKIRHLRTVKGKRNIRRLKTMKQIKGTFEKKMKKMLGIR